MIPAHIRDQLREKSIPDLNMREVTTTPHVFCDSLLLARESQRFGGLVDPRTPNDLIKMKARLFLSSDDLAGCAVEPNGNITAVFKHASKEGGSIADDIMINALCHGGIKLDCYGGNLLKGEKMLDKIGYLPLLYNRTGFAPIARVSFDPAYAEEDFVKKYGYERDIIFFLHNGDPLETVAMKIGEYNFYTPEDYLSLPLLTYDEAYEFREQIIKGRN